MGVQVVTVQKATLLVGSWLNTIFYSIQAIVAIWYLRNHATLPLYKYGIYTSLVVDGACTILLMAHVYLNLVINETEYPGDVFANDIWPFIIIFTYLSAAIEQAFFIHRYWSITCDKWFTAFIALMIVAYNASSIAIVVDILSVSDILRTTSGVHFTISAATICAATDIFIASAMTWRLKHIQTYYRSTKNILRRIIGFAVSCGLTTAVFTTLMLILLFTSLDGWFIVFSVLGRIYSLTVMVNLALLKAVNSRETTSIPGNTDGISEPVVLTPLYFTREQMDDERAHTPSKDVHHHIGFAEPRPQDTHR